MRSVQKRGLVIGVSLVVGVLLGNAVVAFRQAARMHEDSSWVSHTHEVLANLSHFLSEIKDAETGVRGFLLTGEPRFLEPYQEARGEIGVAVDKFASLTADNPVQQARVPPLRKLVGDEMAVLNQAVADTKTGGSRCGAVAWRSSTAANKSWIRFARSSPKCSSTNASCALCGKRAATAPTNRLSAAACWRSSWA